jgi:hypothetical protein
LKSIFMDDYEEVETVGAWNVSHIFIHVSFLRSIDVTQRGPLQSILLSVFLMCLPVL